MLTSAQFTLIQLEYIIALDTYRHFVTASEKCFVTQPTLSMQVKKLEESLGVTIFDRSKQPIVPTDIGEEIIAQARVILREAKRIDELLQQYRQETKGQLRVGIIPTLAPYLLPRFVGNFIRQYPEVQLHIQELQTHDIIRALQNDSIDVGLLVSPLKEPGLRVRPVFYEGILLYLHPRHPLRAQETVALETIDLEQLWLLNEGHCFRSQMINLCAPKRQQVTATQRLSFDYQSNSLETLRQMVDAEGGYTLLPELATLQTEEALPQVRAFAGEMPLREVSLVTLRDAVKRKLTEALYEAVRQAVPEYMHPAARGQVVQWA